ncbi:MAG: iron-containing alcohol dehydrogenase [Candidatus Scalinduaceae bacterium]
MKTPSDELFRFRFFTQIRFGAKTSLNLAKYVQEFGLKRLILVFDQGATAAGPAKETYEYIKRYIDVLPLQGPKAEPEIDELEILRSHSEKFKADGVIGLGGGATIDMAKGLAAVLPNSKPAAEYQGFDLLEKPALPCITVPTLFGSGTEVTPSAVMINRKKNVKGGINGEFVFPKLGVIDPELAMTAPLHLIGATGLDALVHGMEGYVAKCSTPLSRMFSQQGSRMVLSALSSLALDTSSYQAMENLAFGSLLSVTGLMHSESGLCGAISYPLGVYFGVPHGLGGGLCMPAVIRWNSENGCNLYGDLIPGCFDHGKNAAQKLACNIQDLIKVFKLRGLKTFGIKSDHVDTLAKEVFKFKGVLDMNPITITEHRIIAKLIMSAF